MSHQRLLLCLEWEHDDDDSAIRDVTVTGSVIRKTCGAFTQVPGCWLAKPLRQHMLNFRSSLLGNQAQRMLNCNTVSTCVL
jgi:hypothetical protein